MKKLTTLALLAVLLLSACATAPRGPSVMALPGSGKNFEQFRRDDADCRYYAADQISGAEQESSNTTVRNAALGTLIGVLAGAAIDGRHGAAFGAGAGLLFGSASGAAAAQGSAQNSQRAYDHAYTQCMYGKGQRVPVAGRMIYQAPDADDDQPSVYAPPPPPPPPPPPRY